MTQHEKAIPFIKQGWKIFPAYWTGSNHVGFVKWSTESSNDPDILKQWSNEFPGAYYCVNLKASGLVAIDTDNKNGKHGDTVLAAASNGNGPLPLTMKSRTPNNGHHYIFRGDCARGTDKLGSGVDIPHMIPLPGQTVPGKGTYKLMQRGNPETLPAWVVAKAGTARAPIENKLDPITEPDKPHNIRAAIEYAKNADPSIKNQGGNENAYTVCCRMYDLGVSESTCTQILLKHWYPRCIPNHNPLFVEKMTAHAFKYARDQHGNSTPEALFPEIRSTEMIKCASDITLKNVKARRWLIADRFAPGYATVTVAPGGTGKSVLSIIEGFSVVTGKQLTPNEVRSTGAVWLYNMEDPFEELDRRIMAARIHYKLTKSQLENFYYSSGYKHPLKLAKRDQKKQPIANIKAIEYIIREINKRQVKLFIIDPLVKCHSLAENDNDEMDFVMSIFARIAEVTDCAIHVIHHTSKGNGKRQHGNADASRGAGAIINAARLAHTFYNMDVSESKNYGVSKNDVEYYARLTNAKANLSAPRKYASWYTKHSVRINFDDQDTTGVLEYIELDTISTEDEDEFLTNKVMEYVEPGETKSVYSLAKTLYDLGLATGEVKTIQRRICKLFVNSAKGPKGLYKLSEVLSARGKSALSVVCLAAKTP